MSVANHRAGLRLVWRLCVPFCLVYILLGKYVLLLFMDESSAAALATGQMFLWILSPFYFVISAKLVVDGVLRGISAMWQFMAATFTDLILRVVLACVFWNAPLRDRNLGGVAGGMVHRNRTFPFLLPEKVRREADRSGRLGFYPTPWRWDSRPR